MWIREVLDWLNIGRLWLGLGLWLARLLFAGNMWRGEVCAALSRVTSSFDRRPLL